ncbi:hypothetical protein FLP10_17135 [Agromyces intestinalis]|uniref:4-hydroxybenzoate polyprenyltransferase n=1 Tax=Agromyces intestinalis TaxID=2592652 RepID=A0A5C1YKY3_9MICO|nr:hypothetical protein [Agromyces intestinalis]QEO15950.1 hypothetical protein FLP10_17135 [Agromyces intestinalis]
MSLVTAVLASESVNARELPVEPFVYGLVAFVIFLALAIVTYSYRDVANRHRAKAAAYAARHGGNEHPGH